MNDLTFEVQQLKEKWRRRGSEDSATNTDGKSTVIIALVLYVAVVWLVFGKFKLIRLGWASGTIAALIGIAFLGIFLALLNFYTPSGRAVVSGLVVEVTPNVSGQVIEIPVRPNELVKVGTVLFKIDPAPFQYKVTRLEASLVEARKRAEQLDAGYQQATANVKGLSAQVAYNNQRLADIQKLTGAQATSEFRLQDAQVQAENVAQQLEAAQATQQSARLALESEIGGINTSVIQTEALLNDARWELVQTTVVAPGDGYVTLMSLAVGARAVPLRSAMSFNTGVFSRACSSTCVPTRRHLLVASSGSQESRGEAYDCDQHANQ